jgi:2-desacetyl-2-hydroxyethyl bacteriochlorophyllide A dehydrogenase
MTEPGKIEFRDVDAPSPGPGEVLLGIRRIGICGSDLHVYHGTHPYTGYPVVQGHEFSATIEAVGEGVQGLSKGQKVTAMPQHVCGRCGPCRRGDYHICESLAVEGFQAPGVAQDLFVTSAERIIPLPEGFTHEQGALVEPVAVAVHAVSRAPDLEGKGVVVFGAGPIGNLVAQAARARGARVLISDLSQHRLEIARDCGIEESFNPSKEKASEAVHRVFGPERYPVAMECVGVEPTLTDALETLAKGGTLVVVGVFGENPRVNVGLVQDRELTLRGTLMYKKEDYAKAVEYMAGGQVQTDPLISEHFPFEEYLGAYQRIEQAGDKVMKIFIDL